MTLSELFYSGLIELQRLTVRRDFARALRQQRRLRRQRVAVLDEYSHAQAVAYANRMAEASPAYRERLNAAGITLPVGRSQDEWRRLPTLRKTDFQITPERWFSTRIPRDDLLWSCTSGSTGEPYKFPVDAPTNLAEHAANELNLRALGWRPGRRQAVLKMELPPKTGLARVVRDLLGTTTLSFSAVKFKAEDAPEVMAELCRYKPYYLRGYSSVLTLLADEARRQGLGCRIPLITTFGEGLSAQQQQLLETVFQAQAYRDYGGSEAMHIGFECPARTGYHLDLARFKVEILDGDRPCRVGETGEIVVTCFYNGAMPFVRYRMGDLGTLADPQEPCPCGNTMPRLTAVEGRINDTIHTPSGRYVNVLFFVYVLEFAHEHMAGFRVIQSAPDVLEILWIPRHAGAERCLPELEKQIVERTDGTMKVIWKAVPEIPQDASGKRRILVPLGKH